MSHPYKLLVFTLFAVFSFLGACSRSAEPGQQLIHESGIEIEEYPLKYPYCEADMEARCFIPMEGTAEQILAKHSSQRSKQIDPLVFMTHDQIIKELDGGPLVASLRISNVTSTNQIAYSYAQVVVTYKDEIVFSEPLGQMGPVPNMQGLWVHGGHWCLEVTEAVGDVDRSRGIIIQDGKSLQDRLGIDEAYTFTLIDDKPFFFFVRDGKVNASFDGIEIDLGYDEVAHYQCCSGARNNPIKSESMLSYFARRGDIWYYIEAGIFQ